MSFRARQVGHAVAADAHASQLFVLVPGRDGWGHAIAVLDRCTLAERARFMIGPAGTGYRSLVVGKATGRLFLFGNRLSVPAGDSTEALVTVVDKSRGQPQHTWMARGDDGHDWYVWSGGVSRDEHRVYLSYHGRDTTGLDWFDVARDGLVRCGEGMAAGGPIGGCVLMHGDFALHGNGLLVATGGPVIEDVSGGGMVTRRFDTGLEANHLMEFAVAADGKAVYAAGGCDYSGGLSRVDLAKGSAQLLAGRQRTICGQVIRIARDRLPLLGANPQSVVDALTPGRLLVVESADGHLLHSLVMPAAVLDVWTKAS